MTLESNVKSINYQHTRRGFPGYQSAPHCQVACSTGN